VLDGEGKAIHDGVSHSIRKGDVVAVNSYTVHRVVSQEEMPAFCVIINKDFCRFNGIDPAKLQFQSIIRDDPVVEKLFRQVMAAYEGREEAFGNAAFKCALLQLLLELCRRYSSPKPTELSGASAQEYVRRAVRYMRTNFSRKISVDDIAANVGLSKYHFVREFKRITGTTPNRYLNAVRCQYARNLLEDGSHSVKEVAILCGFTNQSYFADVFRQRMGLLPSQIISRNK